MPEKKVVSVRLAEEQVEYLTRTAKRLGWATTSQTAAMLIDEGLRRERFPLIEIRETLAGRTAYVRGTRLQVWLLSRRFGQGESPEEIAESLNVTPDMIRAAQAYAEAFPEEIELALQQDREAARLIPNLPGYTPYSV